MLLLIPSILVFKVQDLNGLTISEGFIQAKGHQLYAAAKLRSAARWWVI